MGPPKMDWSCWRVLTKCGPMEKAMANNFSILALMLLLQLSRFSHVRLFATPWVASHQAPLSLGFSRQEHWSGLPFPSPMHESEKWKCSLALNHPKKPAASLGCAYLVCPWTAQAQLEGDQAREKVFLVTTLLPHQIQLITEVQLKIYYFNFA